MSKRLLFPILVLSAITLLISCSRKMYSGVVLRDLITYPSPPDPARIQFLAKISGSQDVAGKRNSFARFIFGESENIAINKPYGIAVHDGKILVCDTYIHGIDRIDLKSGLFEQFIPKGKGELKVPVNCFVDTRGYLYVADSERKQVVVFDENSNYNSCFGESEDFKPVDIFVLDNKIWVSNLTGHQIHVYSADSTHLLLKKIPELSTADAGRLFSPTNIYVSDDKVYVTDFGDFKIKIYSHEGEFIQSIGSNGQSLGQFSRPKGIAVDRESNLFVVDAGFENVQVFNDDAQLLMFFGGAYEGPGDMWLPAKIILDYENVGYFRRFVDPGYNLKYLIFVTNQFGPDKINIYGAIEPVKDVTAAPTQKR